MTDKCPLHDDCIGEIRRDISGACTKIQRLDENFNKLIEANRVRIEQERNERLSWQNRFFLILIALTFISGMDTAFDAIKFILSKL